MKIKEGKITLRIQSYCWPKGRTIREKLLFIFDFIVWNNFICYCEHTNFVQKYLQTTNLFFVNKVYLKRKSAHGFSNVTLFFYNPLPYMLMFFVKVIDKIYYFA